MGRRGSVSTDPRRSTSGVRLNSTAVGRRAGARGARRTGLAHTGRRLVALALRGPPAGRPLGLRLGGRGRRRDVGGGRRGGRRRRGRRWGGGSAGSGRRGRRWCARRGGRRRRGRRCWADGGDRRSGSAGGRLGGGVTVVRRGRGCRDRNELTGAPGVRLTEDRRVLQEEVRMTARPADPRPHRQLSAGAKRERPASDGAGLELVRPHEIAGTAIAAYRRHGDTCPSP
jgi:hypothetical protein